MLILNEKKNIDKQVLYKLSKELGEKEIVQGKVVSYSKENGLTIDLGDDVKGTMPLCDFSYGVNEHNIIYYIGSNILMYRELKDGILRLNKRELQEDYKDKILNKLKKGTILDTRVVSMASFGAFVDMGLGVLGLLPLGDVSIARFSCIEDVLQKGQDIKVVYNGKSEAGYYVTHKELLGTWEENLSDFSMHIYVLGIVRDIKPYGAFIEISPNLTGLADIPKHLNVKLNDTVCVHLKSVNKEKLKVKLSILSISDTPYATKYKYRMSDGCLDYWRYTPIESIKCIETKFRNNEMEEIKNA